MNRTAHRRPLPTLTALLLSVAGGTIAAHAEADRPAHALAVEAFVQPFVDLAMFDGNVLIDVGGKVVVEQSFGDAHRELGIPNQAQTRFRIASVSKTLTDVALARLIQAGTLSLDARVARYLPSFSNGERITIGQLLDHSSGIPHTNRQPWGDGKISLTLDEIVDRLGALPLDFPPGTDARYSNGGYAVAAKVLEVAVGVPFGEALRRTVFEPLGMEDTAHIPDSRAVIPGMATGYEPGAYPGERRHSRFYAVETRPGGGSCYSTARDLLRLARGVFREGFVEKTLRQQVLGEEEGSFLAQGRSPGFVAKLYSEAEHDVIVVSLANSYAVPADWARALADLATGRGLRDPWPALRPLPGPVAPTDRRLGRYQTSGGREVVIERSPRGALIVEDLGSESITAQVPLADGSFLHPLYFQRCVQDPKTEGVSCRMLSGTPLYASELSRIVP